MNIYQRISKEGFTASELARLAAEHNLGIELDASAARPMNGPIFAGRLLAHEVQPGLTATASDVTYLSDQELRSHSDPTLMFGILLNGDRETMEVEGYGEITREFEKPVLLGVAEKTGFKTKGARDRRVAAAGFLLKPHFFERFGESVADDGLSALKEFVSDKFRYETMAKSSRLLELSKSLLENPYTGQLGQLYLESSTLSLVVEVAAQFKRERKMVQLIGRRHYDRVMTARDVLDSNLIDPPRILDLARHVGVNLTTLQANFKAVLGVTIFGYVRTQRLMMARVLLRDHNLAVAEAGYRVGFASPAAFTAAYRRYFGHPPGNEARSDGK